MTVSSLELSLSLSLNYTNKYGMCVEWKEEGRGSQGGNSLWLIDSSMILSIEETISGSDYEEEEYWWEIKETREESNKEPSKDNLNG